MASPLSERIYEQILQMIVRGEFTPGDRLPSENDLGERFGVSRNTVRAALNKLNVLGFTETKHGGGTYVCQVGNEVYMNFFVPSILMVDSSLLEVLELRMVIEVQAVRLAAGRADAGDVAALRALREEEAAHEAAGDVEALAKSTAAFHTAVAKASHNSMLAKVMDMINSITTHKMRDFLREQGAGIDTGFYHGMVLECIASHKPEEGALMMERYIASLIERVKQMDARDGGSV